MSADPPSNSINSIIHGSDFALNHVIPTVQCGAHSTGVLEPHNVLEP